MLNNRQGMPAGIPCRVSTYEQWRYLWSVGKAALSQILVQILHWNKQIRFCSFDKEGRGWKIVCLYRVKPILAVPNAFKRTDTIPFKRHLIAFFQIRRLKLCRCLRGNGCSVLVIGRRWRKRGWRTEVDSSVQNLVMYFCHIISHLPYLIEENDAKHRPDEGHNLKYNLYYYHVAKLITLYETRVIIRMKFGMDRETVTSGRCQNRRSQVGTRRAVSEGEQAQSIDMQRLGCGHGTPCPYPAAPIIAVCAF